ncbi:putative membrane protein [[Clostridium] sordellii ATCC 9714]|nr:putative membrane protein [[Clostridium] sordellii ATCC 9714] [Paeniclostridium sordellii ATCC 9714]
MFLGLSWLSDKISFKVLTAVSATVTFILNTSFLYIMYNKFI